METTNVENLVKQIQYYQFPNTTMVVCCVTMDNGYNVTGESSCVNKDDFDIELAKSIAKTKALAKVQALNAFREMDNR